MDELQRTSGALVGKREGKPMLLAQLATRARARWWSVCRRIETSKALAGASTLESVVGEVPKTLMPDLERNRTRGIGLHGRPRSEVQPVETITESPLQDDV